MTVLATTSIHLDLFRDTQIRLAGYLLYKCPESRPARFCRQADDNSVMKCCEKRGVPSSRLDLVASVVASTA